MEKGITPVIAIILLLLITISMVGFAFVFLGRTAETASQSGQQQLQQFTSQATSRPKIEAASGSTVSVRNIGASDLPKSSLGFFADDQKKEIISGPDVLKPGEFGAYTLTNFNAEATSALKVTSGGLSDSITNPNAVISSSSTTTTAEVLGSEMVTNGNMESGSPPGIWAASSVSLAAETLNPHGGSQALKITGGDGCCPSQYGSAISNTFTLTSGQQYKLVVWHSGPTSRWVKISSSPSWGSANFPGTTAVEKTFSNPGWEKYEAYFTPDSSGSAYLQIGTSSGPSATFYGDDVSLKPVVA